MWIAARIAIQKWARSRVNIHGERGSAVAEFIMVSGLLVLLVLAVFQLAFALHVRVTLIDCAGEGARAAAVIGSDVEVGAARTRALIASALPDEYAANVTATRTQRSEMELLQVTVTAPLPLIGIFGPKSAITVSGHAIVEESL